MVLVTVIEDGATLVELVYFRRHHPSFITPETVVHPPSKVLFRDII